MSNETSLALKLLAAERDVIVSDRPDKLSHMLIGAFSTLFAIFTLALIWWNPRGVVDFYADNYPVAFAVTLMALGVVQGGLIGWYIAVMGYRTRLKVIDAKVAVHKEHEQPTTPAQPLRMRNDDRTPLH